MTKRSTMLKVVSILMIIFGAIALFTVIGAMQLVNALGGADIMVLAGISPGTYKLAMAISLIACIIEILAGILGLALKNKKTLILIGLICIIIQVVSLIFVIVAHSFSWTSLVGFVLPILYYIGAKQCIE